MAALEASSIGCPTAEADPVADEVSRDVAGGLDTWSLGIASGKAAVSAYPLKGDASDE